MRYVTMNIQYVMRIKVDGDLDDAQEKVEHLFPDLNQLEDIPGVKVKRAKIEIKT